MPFNGLFVLVLFQLSDKVPDNFYPLSAVSSGLIRRMDYNFLDKLIDEFTVCGEIIVIEDERLAEVFFTLPKLQQEVLVMYFFFRYTDKKIGEVYGRSRTTVNYWKLAALKQLRKEWERLEHEERKADTF